MLVYKHLETISYEYPIWEGNSQKKKKSHQAENELEHRSQHRNKEMSGGKKSWVLVNSSMQNTELRIKILCKTL